MSAPVACAVTAWCAHLPGRPAIPLPGGFSPGTACEPAYADQLLGRKGLLFKQPAERLGLCAVHRALGWPPVSGRRTVPPLDPRTAVVASSNLGNVATVCSVAHTAEAGALSEVSPLDAPNVSSNVLASTVAIWFRFGGPNLMVCSGHPSGLDALRLAQVLLAAGRADRVVVVGAEPGDEVASRLFAVDSGEVPLRATAACVVLEPVRAGHRLVLHGVHDHACPRDCDRDAGLTFGPAQGQLDLSVHCGSAYGALGVLQVAAAAGALSGNGDLECARTVCGDNADGWRCALLERRESR